MIKKLPLIEAWLRCVKPRNNGPAGIPDPSLTICDQLADEALGMGCLDIPVPVGFQGREKARVMQSDSCNPARCEWFSTLMPSISRTDQFVLRGDLQTSPLRAKRSRSIEAAKGNQQ